MELSPDKSKPSIYWADNFSSKSFHWFFLLDSKVAWKLIFMDFELDSSLIANSFVQGFNDWMEATEGWVADDSEGRAWECRKLASCGETMEVRNKECTFASLLCRVHIEWGDDWGILIWLVHTKITEISLASHEQD